MKGGGERREIRPAEGERGADRLGARSGEET